MIKYFLLATAFLPMMACAENEQVKLENYSEVGSVCIDGYKFAYATNGYKGGISLVQIYHLGSIPAECKENKNEQ